MNRTKSLGSRHRLQVAAASSTSDIRQLGHRSKNLVLSETQASTPLLATPIWIVFSYQRLVQIEENGFHVLGQTRLVHVIFFSNFSDGIAGYFNGVGVYSLSVSRAALASALAAD